MKYCIFFPPTRGISGKNHSWVLGILMEVPYYKTNTPISKFPPPKKKNLYKLISFQLYTDLELSTKKWLVWFYFTSATLLQQQLKNITNTYMFVVY